MSRRRSPATKVHSLSCTDAEWERVRERADAAGLSISRYLVGRALTVELPRDGDGEVREPPRLVLSEREQREMHDRIAWVVARMSTGSPGEDASLLAQMNDRVALVARSAMLELVQDGRTREMVAVLAEVFGEEEGIRIAERFLEWASGEHPIGRHRHRP